MGTQPPPPPHPPSNVIDVSSSKVRAKNYEAQVDFDSVAAEF